MTFLEALRRHGYVIESVTNGHVVGGSLITDSELPEVERGWDGTPEHADERVGEWLDSAPEVDCTSQLGARLER